MNLFKELSISLGLKGKISQEAMKLHLYLLGYFRSAQTSCALGYAALAGDMPLGLLNLLARPYRVKPCRALTFWATIFLVLILPEAALSQNSPIKSDEEVIFFPTLGFAPTAENNQWQLQIRGWIFEPELESIKRRLLLNSLCKTLTLLEEECDTEVFFKRAQYFLADNERGKSIPIQLGDKTTISSPSSKDGHFIANVTLPDSELRALATKANRDGWLTYNALTKPGDTRDFLGALLPLESTGISVISDIDDTIKVSAVTNLKELLRNCFTRPFKEVAGMPALYQTLAREGASFHYLSASPWQLYPPLAEFFQSVGFPKGTFHMKEFRWKDSRFFDLFKSPEKFKTPILESLISSLPKRRFILVGDSGELDPEIYGEILRRFPDRELRIVIRELPEAPLTEQRKQKAFAQISPSRWRIINDSQLQSGEATTTITQLTAPTAP